MLAFNSCPVLEKLPLQVESIDTWGDKLVVGTATGVLLVYEVKEKNDPHGSGTASPFQASLLESQKSFAKNGKPISQLNVVEKHNILVSLSDTAVSVHELPSFTLKSGVPKARGCTLYALDLSKSFLVMAACVKKKIIIFNWDGNDFIEVKELNIPEPPRTMVWCEQALCVGYKKEYNIINVQTSERVEVGFPPGKSGPPICNLIPPDQLLLGKDHISIFIGFDGKPTKKYGLSWTEPPTLIGYTFPYVMALQTRFVEVRMVTGAQTLLQTLPIRSAKCIADKKHVYIAASNPNSIYRLMPVPLLQQIDQLERDKEFEEAISLCENVEDPRFTGEKKAAKLREIKLAYAYNLFSQGQHEKAMDLFFDMNEDPLRVIGLFPNLLPRDLRAKYIGSDANELVGVALDKAYQALVVYLTKKRSSYIGGAFSATGPVNSPHDNMDYASTTDPPTIMDTTLLKAMMKTNDGTLAPFLRLPNYCHIRECQRVLLDFKKYAELIFLYKCKGLHREALEQLARLGQAPPPAPLGGPAESIAYMSMLGRSHLPLILEFSKWVIQAAPEEALGIFVTDRPQNEKLPADQILAHLKAHKVTLVVPYLEFLISNPQYQGANADFHDELIFQYLDTVLFLQKDSIYQEQKASAAAKGTIITAGTEPGLLGVTRKKLLSFLEDSKHYRPEKMLSRFPFDDLYEERAILLSKISQHDAALTIYAHKLKNYKLAEEYCARHYNPEREDSRDVYVSLLRVYLKPQDPAQPMIQPAMALLSKHYQRIDTPKALELLPSNIPITQLFPFFESVLRDTTKRRRNDQIIKNLLKTENLHMREQLIKARSRVVKITEDRSCPVCNKRLGSSVFACYPNGTVVHFMCLTNQQQKMANLQ